MSDKRVKVWKNERICYYQNKADANFWDNSWKTLFTEDYYRQYEKGALEEYGAFFVKYLQRNDAILEAGCGTARYVVALKAKGYSHIEGIDWGEDTIKRVKDIYPDLPVRVGDAANIDVDSDSYDGYISLGVVEHCEDGPDCYLAEAFRVLKPGGYAFISVPYVNKLRKLKAKLGFYAERNISNMDFYQYAYSKIEFQGMLEKAGFTVVETGGVVGSFAVRDEFHELFKFLDRLPGSWLFNRFVKKLDRYNELGHMILFVCKK
jgi:SAM-dependent methyltransferase